MPLSTISMFFPMIAYQGMLPSKHLFFPGSQFFLNIVQKSSLIFWLHFLYWIHLKFFCLGSFPLAEIILATIRSITLLSLGFWPCNFCLELSPAFLDCYTILDTVLLHIDKFLVIPDTLTPFWNILHIAVLTPSGMWQRFFMMLYLWPKCRM